MTRKGKIQWEVSKRSVHETFIGFEHYALRADGVLITKFKTTGLDGSPRFYQGWNVKNYIPGDDMLFRLKANGFRERTRRGNI